MSPTMPRHSCSRCICSTNIFFWCLLIATFRHIFDFCVYTNTSSFIAPLNVLDTNIICNPSVLLIRAIVVISAIKSISLDSLENLFNSVNSSTTSIRCESGLFAYITVNISDLFLPSRISCINSSYFCSFVWLDFTIYEFSFTFL